MIKSNFLYTLYFAIDDVPHSIPTYVGNHKPKPTSLSLTKYSI